MVDKFKLLVKEETEKTTYYSIAPDYENILSQLTDFNFQTNVKTPTVFAKDPRLSYDLSEMVKELKNACIKSSQDVTTDEKFSSQFNMSSHHQSKKPRASSSVNTPILIDDTSPYSKYIVYRSRHEKEGQVFYHYGPTRSLMVFMFILEYSLRNPTQKITQAEIKKCLHDMGELIKKMH
ncbi:MAG: hypothetical protein HWD59_04770 [Coxiellaceae bacterium]|nr:MAG: hypothetical protein HWD59_04770 [Coxiellaceae bacterium]